MDGALRGNEGVTDTHPTKPGVVTVAGSPAQDLHPKTAASALRQAGLTRER